MIESQKKHFDYKRVIYKFAPGKSYTTSSLQTPPGLEGSKGKLVERCDIRGLPFFFKYREARSEVAK